jgi:hypothetical protein
MSLKEIVTVYSENHTKPINTKYSYRLLKQGDIYLPLGFKGLVTNPDRIA